MKWSFASVGLIVLGLFGIVIIMLFNDITVSNEQDYYNLKYATEASMFEAVDVTYYRLTGEVKISQEKFVENFTRRFTETSTFGQGNYKIKFYQISEYPAKVTLGIYDDTKGYNIYTYSSDVETTRVNVVNELSGILDGFEVDYDKNGYVIKEGKSKVVEDTINGTVIGCNRERVVGWKVENEEPVWLCTYEDGRTELQDIYGTVIDPNVIPIKESLVEEAENKTCSNIEQIGIIYSATDKNSRLLVFDCTLDDGSGHLYTDEKGNKVDKDRIEFMSTRTCNELTQIGTHTQYDEYVYLCKYDGGQEYQTASKVVVNNSNYIWKFSENKDKCISKSEKVGEDTVKKKVAFKCELGGGKFEYQDSLGHRLNNVKLYK